MFVPCRFCATQRESDTTHHNHNRAASPSEAPSHTSLTRHASCEAPHAPQGSDASHPHHPHAHPNRVSRHPPAECASWAALLHQRCTLYYVFDHLLYDRRVCYRDDVLLQALMPARDALAALLCTREAHHMYRAGMPLTAERVRALAQLWLSETCSHDTGDRGAAARDDAPESAVWVDFYHHLLCSSLVRSDADVRCVLQVMQEHPDTQPTVHTFRAILTSVPCLAQAPVMHASSPHTTATTITPPPAAHSSRASNAEVLLRSGSDENATRSSVAHAAAVPRALDRRLVGELAGYYAGHALSSLTDAVTEELWSALYVLCAVAQVAPPLMDLWWDKLLQFYTASLPYACVHAALAWAAANRDVERALRFFHKANQRGVHVRSRSHLTTVGREESSTSAVCIPSGHLTRGVREWKGTEIHSSSTMAQRQSLQLALLAKLMSTAKSIKMDGGLRERVVTDVQRLIDVAVLRRAPWGVINDLMSGLSMPSAMQLLQLRGRSSCNGTGDAEGELSRVVGDERAAHGTAQSESRDRPVDGSSTPHAVMTGTGGGDVGGREEEEPVPFMIWASLLRRCARDHHIDEAEALFKFIARVFPCHGQEKRELVEIMMRMYAALPVPDYTSAANLFLDHVVRTPAGAPVVKADVTLYNILIRAADSRNAAMMTFMEGCAEGVGFNRETFDALLSSSPYGAVTHLSRKLPHDYPSSILDAQLRIPANVDAHKCREDALRARGKPLYDSTGDAAS